MTFSTEVVEKLQQCFQGKKENIDAKGSSTLFTFIMTN